MVTVIGTTFTKDDKLEDLTRVVIDTGFQHEKDSNRIHIYLGTTSLHMTLEQCMQMINKINEKIIPILKSQTKVDLNIEVGNSMEMKDSLGKDN